MTAAALTIVLALTSQLIVFEDFDSDVEDESNANVSSQSTNITNQLQEHIMSLQRRGGKL